MADFILSCCSSADLSKERFDARGIKYLCFHFSLNGIEYPDDLGQTVPPAQLYERMLAGENSKTSQPSAGEYIDFFEQFLSEGKDVLHVTLSTGISGGLRTYDWPVVIRAVNTRDAVTATVEDVPFALLQHITERITHEVPGVNRVLYDLTPKPTGTIEWE